MNEICQKYLPICPWEKKSTSRLPGIQPLNNNELLYIQDDAYDDQMSYRDYLIKNKRHLVFQINKRAITEALELLKFLLCHLKGNSNYKFFSDRVQRPDNKVIYLKDEHPLIVAGRLVQEDLLILDWSDKFQEHILIGGILCFPALWTLKEKINKPLSRIHKPVRNYDKKITKSVQRMFNNIKVNKPLWRANWYLYENPELFSPLEEKFSHQSRKDYFDANFWVRVERQSLMRLPNTKSVIFGIHTYVVNKKDLTKNQIISLRNSN